MTVSDLEPSSRHVAGTPYERAETAGEATPAGRDLADEILRLRDRGLSYRRIGMLVGRSKGTVANLVNNRLHAESLKFRDVVLAMAADGASFDEISTRIGRPASFVAYTVRRHGDSDVMRRMMSDLYRRGMTRGQIARHLKLGINYVMQTMRNMRADDGLPDDINVGALYYGGASPSEIARLLDCTTGRISHLLARLPRPTGADAARVARTMRRNGMADRLIARRLRVSVADVRAMIGKPDVERRFTTVDDYLAVCGGCSLTVNHRDIRTGGDLLAATGLNIQTLSRRSGKDPSWLARLADRPVGGMRLGTVDQLACSAGLVIDVRGPRDVDWVALADRMFPDRKGPASFTRSCEHGHGNPAEPRVGQ